MQGMATTAYIFVLLGAMTTQMMHYTRSLFLYYLLALAGSILTLYPLDKVLVHLGVNLAICLLKGSPWGSWRPLGRLRGA